jgi:hypothetical protein
VPEDSIENESPQVPPTPTSPNRGEDDDADDADVKKEPETKTRGRPGRKPGRKAAVKSTTSSGGGRQPKAAKDVKKSVASRRLHNSSEMWEIDEEAFEDFDYHLENVDQFDPDRCRELEETYWKTINFGTPMYGADMPGSLFSDDVTSWNVAHLPNLLDVLGTKVPGVNTAYLYLGMWKATFAWHLEDVDLYSINYIHFGAPKQWYSISQCDARKFEQAMRTLWPQDYKHCDQFLRHKTYLISPEKLKSQFGIKVNKLVHYEGEFVITYPYGYHSGFNLGYNCAESVNFATEDWINYGRIARKCLCEADSVWVDVNEIERKLRGEPTPEYYEVTDDESDEEEEVLPTPPPSVRGKSTAGKKRKRPTKETKAAPEKKKKRVMLRLRAPSKEPCMLCPNDASWDPLLPTDNGKKAHRICALYTPETYLREDETTKKEIVCNVSHIAKDRLDMRCNFCRSKKGSVFQCASRKCTRAFHATCAAAAGVLVDEGPVPTWDESGVEYHYIGFDFRCRFHRPRRPKNSDGKLGETLEKDRMVARYGKSLEEGQVVQALLLDGDVFAGVVKENRAGEGVVLLSDIFGQPNAPIEVEYKYLLVLDPAQSQRPKPSPDAKPLPENLSNTKDHSADNRKDGVPTKGDPFLDPAAEQVWEEFNAVHSVECKNPFQKKVDLFAGEKKPGEVGMWYFLGKTSTEARPQFTHDPKVEVNNPKANFLESVREKEAPRYTPNPVSSARPVGYGSYVNYGTSFSRPQPTLQPRPIAAAGSPGVGAGFEVKPYEYKPKTSMPTGVYDKGLPYTKWQVNTPATAQQRTQQRTQNYPQTPRYSPPGGPTNAYYSQAGQRPLVPYQTPGGAGKSTTPPGGPGMGYPPPAQNAESPLSNSNTGSFYAQAERRYSQASPPSYGTPQPPSRPSTSVSHNNHGKAVAKPTSIEHTDHIKTYPYLRNAYARRPDKYVSPYAGGFGFSGEYEMKLQRGVAARGYAQQAWREMEMKKAQQAQQAASDGQSQVQYQTPADFQAQVQAQASGGVGGGSGSGSVGMQGQGQQGWNELLSRISPATAPTAQMMPGVERVHSPARPEFSPISGRASPAVPGPVGLGIAGTGGPPQ